jgi:hypothetical protein
MKKPLFFLLLLILSIDSMAQSIPSYVPTNGLVLWFPFSNSILNQGGLSTTGTSTNFNSTFVKDRFNRPNSAVFFNQNSNCATRIENSINGSFINGAMTLSFWVNRDSAGCDNPRILNIDATNGTRLQTWWNNNSQTFTFTHQDLTKSVGVTFNAVSDKTWVHIVYTNDGTIANFYQNGILVSSTPNAGMTVSIGNNAVWGMLGTSFQYHGGFRGSIDDIGIWNRALSANEVASLKNAYQATILNVNKTSTSSIENGSLTNPYKTIQAAINNSQNGDSIIVAPGRYKENIVINNKNIFLTSNFLFSNDTNSIVNTIIDGDSVSNALYLNNFNGTINGFTVERGFASVGAGIKVENSATPTIRYCTIQKNRGQGDITAHGISMGASNGLIEHCIIRNNWGRKHTVHLNGTTTFRNSKVINNTATEESNVVVSSSAKLYNLIIVNNFGGGLKIWPGASQAQIRNLTIVNNSNFGVWVWGLNTSNNTVGNISNSIIWGNTTTNIKLTQSSTAITTLNIDNSIVENGSAGVNVSSSLVLNYGSNNSSANPVFKSVTNFELNSNSPAIGMGNTSALLGGVTSSVPSTDIIGNTRPSPVGSNPDIGAYESSFGTPTRLDTVQLLSLMDTSIFPIPATIFLNTKNISTKNIIAYNFKLNYNSSKFKFDSVSTINTASAGGTLQVNSVVSGSVNIGWARTIKLTGTQPIINLYFTPIDSGKAEFTLSNAYLNADSVTTVTAKSVVTKFNFGDIDLNKKILAYDAALALQYSVGMDPMPTIDPLPWEPWRIKVASVDTAIVVNANDASLILKYSVGVITKFPKRGIVSAPGYVTVNLENNELVVRSFEDMGGLNITFLDHLSDLGAPTYVHNTNALSAFNKQTNMYKIGVAFSEAPVNGTVILRIPYTGLGSQTLNMELVENTAARNYQLNVLTGINDIKNSNIKIYPNPTNNIINIEGLTKNENNTIQIFDVQGKLVITKTITEKGTIDLSELNKGVYVIKIGEVAQRIVKM